MLPEHDLDLCQSRQPTVVGASIRWRLSQPLFLLRRFLDKRARINANCFADNFRFQMHLLAAPPRRLPPEVDLLVLSFLGHFAWEILQAPLFASLGQTEHFAGILICLKATLGDLAIALAAFWSAALVGRDRNWIADTGAAALAVFFAVGLLMTVGLEYLHTEVTNRWAYDRVMPTLPIIGTGLSPILQWVFVPLFVLWYMRRLTPSVPILGRDPQ